MRIDVSEPEICCCVTCVQHRTSGTFNTQETEPSNVMCSSVTSIPVSSRPVQALGDESSALGSTSTSSPVHSFSPISSGTETPLAPPVTSLVNSEPAQSIDSTFTSSTSVQSSSPTIFSFRPAVTPVSSEPTQALGPTTFGSFPVPVSDSPPPFAASGPSIFWSSQAPVTDLFGSGASITSTSSTSSPFDALSPPRWGSMQAPVQASAPNTSTPFISFLPAQDSGKTASAFPSLCSDRGDFARPNFAISPAINTPTPTRSFGETHFFSPFGPTQDFAKTGTCVPGSGVNYLPRYPSNLFGPNPQTTTPVSGSRYPRYAPTPDIDNLGDQGKMMISISASNSHRHKSHEELRWEDYKKGDKGGFGWFPPAHISPFSSSTVLPSLFASPSLPDHPQRTNIGPPQGNMTDFPFGNTPTAVQRPHESAGVSSTASGFTACGATNSSSPSGYLGFNVATNPALAATSLPGLFFSTSGSCPLMFGTPNLAAHGTTTTPAVQAYPMVFGTQTFAAQGTTTRPALQPYPMRFGTPNILAQGTTTAPAVQAYPMVFGTQNLSAQGTTRAALQPYPMMFGTPNISAQGTTTAPAVQSYPMMFGTPNLAAQCTTPAVQAYTVHGLILLPFAAMRLQ